MTRKFIPIILGLVITAYFAAGIAGYVNIPFLKLLEFAIYDARVRLTAHGETDPRIVIIDIDEKSLAAEGRWPWRRDRIGELVKQLTDKYQVEVIAFDMVFPEKDRNFSMDQLREFANQDDDAQLLRELDKYEPLMDRDKIFSKDIEESGRVVLGYFFHHDPDENSIVGTLPPPLFDAESGIQNTTYAIQATGYAANLDVLQSSALSGGYFSNPVVDDDGVYRRIPVIVEYEGNMYPALALAAVQSYLGIDAEPVLAPGNESLGDYPALEALDVAGALIPLDANATTLVPYKGPEGTFTYISATDVLNGVVPDGDLLAGTIALIGTTAAGLVDLRPTPVQNVYPGVEIHANMIAGILDDEVKQQPAYTIAVDLLTVIMSGLILSFLLSLTSPLVGGVITFLIVASIGTVNVYAWDTLQHVIPFASALSVIALIYVMNVIFGFFFETRRKNALGKLFGQYIPPELVDEMSRDPGSYSLEGQKRELTVLFSDVRNFTSISEKMDAGELTRMMNSFLTPLTGAVHRSKGTIDKYMGDALMAFWGAPIHLDDHASRAVSAALEMRDHIERLGPDFEAEGWSRIKVGIGVNTGEMSVGNMGSEFRVAYTVMGDAVNLGSRIEGLTKIYGVDIIASEFTVAEAPGFHYLELDQVRVKGKQKPVGIFAPLGEKKENSTDYSSLIESQRTALDDFRNQRFAESLEWFSKEPPLPSLAVLFEMYRQRIALFMESPPDKDWDGVFELTTK
ncbi:MAG: adenylate/guanylate cyclase domain-containing protein [marine bacterium B5-7]|nr:MAG: adenylate/guanylate cyclase domain-containing protein [marine bacterium B5-7]